MQTRIRKLRELLCAAKPPDAQTTSVPHWPLPRANGAVVEDGAPVRYRDTLAVVRELIDQMDSPQLRPGRIHLVSSNAFQTRLKPAAMPPSFCKPSVSGRHSRSILQTLTGHPLRTWNRRGTRAALRFRPNSSRYFSLYPDSSNRVSPNIRQQRQRLPAALSGDGCGACGASRRPDQTRSAAME